MATKKKAKIREIPGAPPTPDHILTDPGKLSAWNSIVEDLSLQGNLVVTDRELIEVAATVMARLRQISKEVDQLPSLVTINDRGNPVQHPSVQIEALLTTKVNKLLNDLRLTPATRSKATLPTGCDTEGWEPE